MPEFIHYLVEGKVEAPIDWVSFKTMLGACMYRVKWHIIVGPLLLPFLHTGASFCSTVDTTS